MLGIENGLALEHDISNVKHFAKRGYRAVGMCSAAASYSTFSCSNTGVYEDFYIEPAFRGKGLARKLAESAQKWCRENGIRSLTVCCAPSDIGGKAMMN